MTTKINELKYKTFKHLGVNELGTAGDNIKEINEVLGYDFGEEVILKEKSQISTEYEEHGTWAITRDSYAIDKNDKFEFGLCYWGDMNHAVNLRLRIKENAKAKVYLIFNMFDCDLLGKIDIKIEENAELEFAPLFIMGENVIMNIHMSLAGENSKFHMEGGYIFEGNNIADINVHANHYKNSESIINMHGILLENSKKTYKYTLNFPQGAENAKGSESERVIALADKFKNIVVPVLLVGEDNIEADHGAEITQFDKEKLDYMYSRGINKETAEFMSVKTELSPVIDMNNARGKEIIKNRLFEIFPGGDNEI